MLGSWEPTLTALGAAVTHALFIIPIGIRYGDSRYGDNNCWRELQRLLPNPNVLVAISKGMPAVKLCINKILQFLMQVDLYNGRKTVLLCVYVMTISTYFRSFCGKRYCISLCHAWWQGCHVDYVITCWGGAEWLAATTLPHEYFGACSAQKCANDTKTAAENIYCSVYNILFYMCGWLITCPVTI